MTSNDAENSPSPGNPRSSAFWRKRLSRALLLGALLIVATQLLPALPQEQRLLFRAPEGKALTQVDFTYYKEGDRAPLGGAQLRFPGPISQAPHGFELPNGRYRVEALGWNRTEHWSARTTVELKGGTATIHF